MLRAQLKPTAIRLIRAGQRDDSEAVEAVFCRYQRRRAQRHITIDGLLGSAGILTSIRRGTQTSACALGAGGGIARKLCFGPSGAK
jgi:hypothetical protein